MEKRIVSVAEAAKRGMTAVVYGRSGTGKTWFGGTWPKPLLLIDTKERGTETIANVQGVQVISIEEWIEFEQIYWYIRKNGSKFKTIMVDQATALQSLGMTEIRIRSKKSEKEIFSQKNWGQLSGLLQTWIGNFRDLADDGTNILFLAHERVDSGEEEVGDNQIAPEVGARLMPSVSGYLNGAVSVIGNTFIREKFVGPKKERQIQFCMRIGPHAVYVTKLRKPADQGELPSFIVNPSYQKLMDLQLNTTPKPKVVRKK